MFIALPAVAAFAQETVRVVGTVRDETNAIALPGTPVELVGTTQVVYTDVDGRYVIQLPPGEHQLRVALDGYQPRVVTVTLGAERTVTADVGLSMVGFAESVKVEGVIEDSVTSSAEAQLIVRQRASVITDNLGAQEMRQNADSDAAAAMQRVTGLSVVDNQYVFVRGLGERYSNTTLNGAVIPTTEPDRKVVPLDLFPSGLLSSVTIAKSYTPDRSADFAGGLVEIVPLKFPNRRLLDVSWGVGVNSRTSGETVPGYAGGGGDWRGFDDGGRSLPSSVPARKVIRGGIYTPDVGVLRADLERIGESFSNNWNLESRSTKPNQTGAVTFGGNVRDKFGLLVSYTQAYKEQFNTERQVFYRTDEGGLSEFSDYDFQYATSRANVGALGNFSVQPTPTQRITLENFYTHSGKDEARTFEGFNSDIATDIRNQRLFWVEEELLSTGLTGEHFFSGIGNSRIDWRATRSAATRDEPDLREVLYERNGNVFVLSDESQSGLRMFNNLDDRTTDVAANWSTFSSVNGLPTQFKFGGQYVERSRDFSSRRFRFTPLSTSGIDLTSAPEAIFTPQNIGAKFELKEETRVTDTYAAEQTIASFYAMTDFTISSRVRLIGGVRVEQFDQTVDTFDPFDFEGDPDITRARIEETDVFPSVNFVFSPRIDQNLRLSFSQTVNRPEFREVAQFEFTDVVGGRAVVGNPNLKRALIQNFDFRYEMFPRAEEVLAVSVFFKRFDDPIERVIQRTAQLRTSFTNADSARNVGFELEGRKRLGEHFLVGSNYTFVDSTVSLTAEGAQVQTSNERALAGQSKNLFNILTEARAGSTSVRLLYNFFGKRITDIGAEGLPDIIEDSRGTFDLVASTRLFEKLNLRVSAENLTDEDYRSTQSSQIQRLYRLGRTFTFNFGFSAF
jgi:outer membrane receptor protein involved in Fe transport